MVRKCIVNILIIMIMCVLCYAPLLSAQSETPMPPILDNSIEPSLCLWRCRGAEEAFPDGEGFNYHPLVNEKKIKKIKSKNVTWVKESWHHSDSGGVSIERWYFSCPEDAALFPETGMITTENDPFRGWDKTADVGDKTYWNGPDYVIFTKGNVAVKVILNRRRLSTEQQKSYTKKIAQSIANKL